MTTKPTPKWTPTAILALRNRLGLTQDKFARRLDIPAMRVSAWECDRNKPSPVMCRLLDELAATPEP